MENNTRLPAGLVNGIYRILLNHSHANRTVAAEEIAQYVVEEYATKLHQVEQENSDLRRHNDKLKEKATGWRPLLADDAVQNWFEENIDKDLYDLFSCASAPLQSAFMWWGFWGYK